ncbi:MAG: ArsC family reductase [Rhodocyclaceae bacterium]|nr:ArsC family reductase [Rhodocyclaceae bacterium]MBX3668406.1 ArsC family reductase [Rhodocyclaceae bacterium]
MLTIYGIKNCDTMKKAMAWLDQHGIEYQFHDYKKSGVPLQRLQAWLARAGWETLVNRRGPTFRKLPPERQNIADAAAAVALLEQFPSAIKRPVIEAGTELLVGYDPDEYTRVFGK